MKSALLAIASVLVFLCVLEVGARVSGLGTQHPVAAYIADWERQWDGEFYTLGPRPGVNSEGLRDEEHPLARTPGVPRLAILGDSVTFGFNLPAEHSYPAQLRADLAARGQPTEVMNVALPGWSTRQQRIAYERILRPYRPDHLILGFCLNDVAETQNNLARPPALVAALYRRSHLVRALLRAQAWEIGQVEELFFEPDSRSVKEGWRRTFAELDELADAVLADGVRFSLLALPFRFQLDQGAPPPLPQERLRAWAEARGVGYLDALPGLKQIGHTGFLDYDHLSPAGARRVAQELALSGLVAGD